MIHKIKNILNKLERKQVGILYHSTHPVYALEILNSNILRKGRGGFVSFTRDRNLDTVGVESSISFVVGGDKLSDKYKIEPYTDIVYSRSHGISESEEIIKSDIEDINKYIIKILIKKDKFINLLIHGGSTRARLFAMLDLNVEDKHTNETILHAFVNILNDKFNMEVKVL